MEYSPRFLLSPWSTSRCSPLPPLFQLPPGSLTWFSHRGSSPWIEVLAPSLGFFSPFPIFPFNINLGIHFGQNFWRLWISLDFFGIFLFNWTHSAIGKIPPPDVSLGIHDHMAVDIRILFTPVLQSHLGSTTPRYSIATLIHHL